MVGGTIMGYLGGLHYWWPKISGRLYNESLAKFSALIIFVGFNLTFFPQFVLGYLGMPRRYHAYPQEFQVLNVLSSAGASILGVGYLIPMLYLMWSLRYGPLAGSESVGRRRPRVDDDVAAADGELRGNADRHLGSVRVSRTRGDPCRLTAPSMPARTAWSTANASLMPLMPLMPLITGRSHTSSTTWTQQREAATLGMWVFLATEVLFFGVLFATYAIYRAWYPDAFAAASHELLIWLGTINTAVLITSSLTMALAVHAAQTGERRRLLMFLVLTMILGAAFLGIKGYEYYSGFVEHHVPGADFQFEPEHFQHAQIFFSLYFIMTGLHAVHMIVGLGRHGGDAVAVVARHDLGRVLQPDRDQRAVLALRRHRVDFPVSAAVSDRTPCVTPDMPGTTYNAESAETAETREGSIAMSEHILPTRVYYTIFGVLMLCTYLTVQMAFVDLGAAQRRRRARHRRLQGDARRPLFHAREVQLAPDLGGRHRQRVLAGYSAGADDERLPDAQLAHVRVSQVAVVQSAVVQSCSRRSAVGVSSWQSAAASNVTPRRRRAAPTTSGPLRSAPCSTG